jgi:hypothetical protein
VFSRGLLVLLALGYIGSAMPAEPRLKDPMRPYSPPPAGAGAPANDGYRLTTIVHSADRHVAVINGKALRVGDQIGAAQVVAIEAWQVRLMQGDKSILISLSRSKVRDDIIQREAKP